MESHSQPGGKPDKANYTDAEKFAALERLRDHLTSNTAAHYDRAANYTNLILAAGYAGFFGVWSAMKDTLSRTEMLISALSVSASLTVFVLWEVYKMMQTAADLKTAGDVALGPLEGLVTRIEQATANKERAAVSAMRSWRFVLVLTLVPGLIGGATLMASFVRQLFK